MGRAKKVFGLDLSASVVEAGRLITDPNFIPVQASGDALPFKNGVFDFVYCWGVLHHTKDPSKTLREVWRVVKPGGRLAIWVYPKDDIYLRRSLLSKYFSNLTSTEMLDLSNLITSL